MLVDIGFPLHMPKCRSRAPSSSSKWSRCCHQKQEAKLEHAAHIEALSSMPPSSPRCPLSSRIIVTTHRSPSPLRAQGRTPSRTPGHPNSKAVKFDEPKPLPPPVLKSLLRSTIHCHDVRLTDGKLDKDSVRIESASDTPTPPIASSSLGRSGKQ